MHFNPVLYEETSLTIIFIVKKQFNKLRQKGNQSPIGSNRATLLQKLLLSTNLVKTLHRPVARSKTRLPYKRTSCIHPLKTMSWPGKAASSFLPRVPIKSRATDMLVATLLLPPLRRFSCSSPTVIHHEREGGGEKKNASYRNFDHLPPSTPPTRVYFIYDVLHYHRSERARHCGGLLRARVITRRKIDK